MEKKNIALLFGLVLVVAVVAGAVGAGITGNFIRVRDWQTGGSYKVYTRGEIDNMLDELNNKATYLGVAELFGDADSTGKIWLGHTKRNGEPVVITNGHSECGSTKECLLGFGGFVYPNTRYFDFDTQALLSCDETIDLNQYRDYPNWNEDTRVIVQYLCIDNEILEWADKGFPQ